MECIFCEIVKKERAADIIAENADLAVFKDIHPKAPVHLLIVPKKHISSVRDLEDNDAPLAGKMVIKARDMAEKNSLSGYKLIFNVGREGGQVIDHLHLHLLGGWDTHQAE